MEGAVQIIEEQFKPVTVQYAALQDAFVQLAASATKLSRAAIASAP